MQTITNFFKDSQGRVVIGQWPNYPLWIAIVSFFLSRLPVPILQPIGFWGLIISLLYWSYLEIVYGVNTWRRFLGLVVGLSQLLKLLGLLVPTF